MANEIVILSGGVEAPHLCELLRRHDETLVLTCVETRDELGAAFENPAPEGGFRRLLAYCTNVIVPPDVLGAASGPSYNFHPGPPEFPGAFAASFAIYAGAAMYGVTAHEMTETVDSGNIVGVIKFPVPDKSRFTDLELRAYGQLFKLFARLASHLARDPEPLPRLNLTWGGKKTTKADFERMKTVTPEMDEDEIKLRWRAFG